MNRVKTEEEGKDGGEEGRMVWADRWMQSFPHGLGHQMNGREAELWPTLDRSHTEELLIC